MIPESFRPVAKAIVALLIPLVGLLVAVGVLDIEVGKKITAELIGFATALGLLTGGGVYVTRNVPGPHRGRGERGEASLPLILILLGIVLAFLVHYGLGIVCIVIGLVLLIWPLVVSRRSPR